MLDRDHSEQPLLSWEEIAEMHESGLVDFQSHTWSHSLVYRGTRAIDFVHPGLLDSCCFLELPCPVLGAPISSKSEARLGEPLFPTAPRLSDRPALRIDRSVFDRCAAYAAENGGREFFLSPEWRARLVVLLDRLMADAGAPVPKRKIEEMLPGKRVEQICYPWHEAGRTATILSLETGNRACYWGRVDGRYRTPVPGDPFRIARIGEDFVLRLPGAGRETLGSIISRKVRRRARAGSPYLTH